MEFKYIKSGDVIPLTLNLANNATDNSMTIANANGATADVTLSDRTLFKDGAWNTICLPFDLTLENSPLADAEVMALTTSTYTAGTLNLVFSDVTTTMEAGKPYIIKWEGNGTNDLVDPVFSGVQINKTKTEMPFYLGDDKSITFVGTYDNISFTATDKSILFLGDANKLYYPETGASIGACRAAFYLNGLTAAEVPANNVKLFFGDVETAMETIDNTISSNGKAHEAWYDLNGRKIENAPSHRGIYINNAKKMMIK